MIRGRSIKFAVVVVVSNNADEISEDRMIALRKRAEVDAKYVIVLNPNDTANLKVSLHRHVQCTCSTFFRELCRFSLLTLSILDVGWRVRFLNWPSRIIEKKGEGLSSG